MTFQKEILILKAIKKRKRASMAWKTICRIYAELRQTGLIVKCGKSHILTEKGKKLLEILE
jgi:predicted transcriptional regulator